MPGAGAPFPAGAVPDNAIPAGRLGGAVGSPPGQRAAPSLGFQGRLGAWGAARSGVPYGEEEKSPTLPRGSHHRAAGCPPAPRGTQMDLAGPPESSTLWGPSRTRERRDRPAGRGGGRGCRGRLSALQQPGRKPAGGVPAAPALPWGSGGRARGRGARCPPLPPHLAAPLQPPRAEKVPRVHLPRPPSPL